MYTQQGFSEPIDDCYFIFTKLVNFKDVNFVQKKSVEVLITTLFDLHGGHSLRKEFGVKNEPEGRNPSKIWKKSPGVLTNNENKCLN